MQRYKVFVKDVPIIFKNDGELNTKEVELVHPDELVKSGQLVISGEPIENMNSLFSNYKWIVAAGGLVLNQSSEVLVIKRNGLWDLPKGKLEKGESVDECAVREVEEECSVENLKIIRELPSTFHTYFHKGKDVLKRTYWYEMSCPNQTDLVPQAEEGIEEVKWIRKNELLEYMSNGYKSLHDFVETYLKL